MKTRKRKSKQRVKQLRHNATQAVETGMTVDLGAFEDEANGWMAATPVEK